MITYQQETGSRGDEIARLFGDSFTTSDGAEEGALVGTLAARLMAEVSPEDLHVFCARDGAALVGAILFTRMHYADPRWVVMLAPVAVATAHQGQGIGQALISHGLGAMRAAGAEVALTYGDPAFYTRLGFGAIHEADIPAPLPLSMPHGWLGQSLSDRPLGTLTGPARCVAPFDVPALW